MHLYQSGTPRNDAYQTVENRLCTHRLFSMHGDYERAVLRWLEDVKDGVFTSADFLKKYPEQLDGLVRRDVARRAKQVRIKDERDWNTLHMLEKVCDSLTGNPYPRCILLDSGAFTAWNKGDEVSVDEVLGKYSRFIEGAGSLFDEIWMINLDKIPGERGRDPTLAELKEAVEVSDRNFEILVKEFGNHVLPVFHQGEATSRLYEVMDQVKHGSNYICVSPRNDVAEGLRVDWSAKCHKQIGERSSLMRTHGLATTGNKMIRTVPWYSGDSAAWVQHGGYGMVDIFIPPGMSGKRKEGHYTNYFISIDQMELDTNNYNELIRGKAEAAHKFIDKCSEDVQRYIVKVIQGYGFNFAAAQWDSRIRNLVCMGELQKYADWAKASVAEVRPPASLFGGFDNLE